MAYLFNTFTEESVLIIKKRRSSTKVKRKSKSNRPCIRSAADILLVTDLAKEMNKMLAVLCITIKRWKLKIILKKTKLITANKCYKERKMSSIRKGNRETQRVKHICYLRSRLRL